MTLGEFITLLGQQYWH